MFDSSPLHCKARLVALHKLGKTLLIHMRCSRRRGLKGLGNAVRQGNIQVLVNHRNVNAAEAEQAMIE